MLFYAFRHLFYSLLYGKQINGISVDFKIVYNFSIFFNCSWFRRQVLEAWEFPAVRCVIMFTVRPKVCVRFVYEVFSNSPTCGSLASCGRIYASSERSLCTWLGCPSRERGVASCPRDIFLRPSWESVVREATELQSAAPPAPLPPHTGTTTLGNHQ